MLINELRKKKRESFNGNTPNTTTMHSSTVFGETHQSHFSLFATAETAVKPLKRRVKSFNWLNTRSHGFLFTVALSSLNKSQIGWKFYCVILTFFFVPLFQFSDFWFWLTLSWFIKFFFCQNKKTSINITRGNWCVCSVERERENFSDRLTFWFTHINYLHLA